jgi:hypothetical protein
MSYALLFHKQFYFVISSLKIIHHGNPGNLESFCTFLKFGFAWDYQNFSPVGILLYLVQNLNILWNF